MSLDFADWLAIQQIYVDYAAVLDAGDFNRWRSEEHTSELQSH